VSSIAIEQVRWYYDLGGAPRYVTGCQNSDNVSPITTYKEYNAVCKNLVNIDQLTVTPNYRTLTRLNDKTLEVKGCQYDNNVSLEATYEGCGQRHDFMINKTYEQERLFYLWEGERNYVTSCRDSEVAYPHYLTTATCQYQNANGKVIVNKRIAYNQSDGTVGYATNCKPVSDEIAIEQEFCGYEHDFIVSQSYHQERDYFVDPINKERVYLTLCSRTNINFPHKQESSGWIHNDAKLQSSLRVRKYFIDTTNNAKIYPNGQDWEEGLPVPYANAGVSSTKGAITTVNDTSLRKTANSYTWNNIALDTSLAVPTASGTYTELGKGRNYCVYSGEDCYESAGNTFCADNYSPTASCSVLGFGAICINNMSNIARYLQWGSFFNDQGDICAAKLGLAKIAEIRRGINYLRPDGSTYSSSSGDSSYQVQP
jgi:hypothetical protein